MDEAVQVVQAWQEAANRQDVAGVLARSAPDIVIVGPRGAHRADALGRRDPAGRHALLDQP